MCCPSSLSLTAPVILLADDGKDGNDDEDILATELTYIQGLPRWC